MATTTRRRAPLLFSAGILIGVVMMLIGAGWSTFVEPENVWSTEQAAEFKAANDALHSVREQPMSSEAGGDPQSAAQVRAAQERFERISAQLESARYAHESWGRWISAGGLVLAFLCGLGFLASRGAEQ